MRLAEIHVYPLKGARGIALDRAEVLAGGLRHDRRFMLLGKSGDFLTQRTHPRLAHVTTTLASSTLGISVVGAGSVEVALAPDGPRRTVRCWEDDVEAVVVEGAAAQLLSDHLAEACTLVFMPDDVVRPVEAPHGTPGDRVGFADAYPVLLAARASLADLNTRLAQPVPMDRFRPNLVIEGGAAYEEESFASVRVGGTSFRMPKRCSRCQVVTVDQATGETSKEPLRTLAAYRTENNNVYFAQNLIPNGTGELRVGDEVSYSGRLAT